MAKDKKTKLTANDKHRILQQMLNGLAGNAAGSVPSVTRSRANIAWALGKSFGGDRDLYEALGYPQTLDYSRYLARFTRQDLAKTIVTAFPNATWTKDVLVYETEEDTETKFEKSWAELQTKIRVYHYLNRLDILAGIGSYAVLYLGLDDTNNTTPEKKVKGARSLLYVKPYSEANAAIKKYETNKKSPRCGLPLMYTLTTTTETPDVVTQSATTKSASFDVHWSRVIHVPAEGCLESDVFGPPGLECVYNRLQDMEMIAGGSAEAFWRNAYPGLALEADKDVDLTQGADDLTDEIEKYMHRLNRYIRLQGIKVNQLRPEVASPKDQMMMELQLISGAKRIPLRILIGSERGELASNQDEKNWNDRVNERRGDYAEPRILREFIDRLVEHKVLEAPGADGYLVQWPQLYSIGEKEQAEITKVLSEAIAKYSATPGADVVMPLYYFLTEIMRFDDEKARAIIEAAEQEQDEDDDDADDGSSSSGPVPDEDE